MSREDFAKIIAYIGAGCQKVLPDSSQEAYFDALGDIPVRALWFAAKRTVLEHKYATFPPASMIRDFAFEVMRGHDMTASEAWKVAYRVSCKLDPSITGPYMSKNQAGEMQLFDSQFDALTHGLPLLVVEAIRRFGPEPLSDADKPEVARAHFLAIYKELAETQWNATYLPAWMQEEKQAIKYEMADRNAMVKQIGQMPE